VRAQADMLAQSGVALLMGMAGANPSEELMTQLLHVLRNVAQHGSSWRTQRHAPDR
jgi:hypothetical protein